MCGGLNLWSEDAGAGGRGLLTPSDKQTTPLMLDALHRQTEKISTPYTFKSPSFSHLTF